MAALPVEVLRGASLGLLLGVASALVVVPLAFVRGRYAERSPAHVLFVVVGLAMAVVNGYTIGVLTPGTLRELRAFAAVPIVVAFGLYTSSLGHRLATELPGDAESAVRRTRTLSADAVDAVDGAGQITIRATGEVRDVDGHPSLDPGRRRAIEDGAWRLPADLPPSELETRLERRLRTEYDLAAASVSIDGRGLATVAAAPSEGGLAERIPDGARAVSITAPIPAGLTVGETVTVATDAGSATGPVLGTGPRASVYRDDPALTGGPFDRATDGSVDRATDGPFDRATDEGDRHSARATGGVGSVTVGVSPAEADDLLDAEHGCVLVRPGNTSRAFEAASLLDRDGTRIGKVGFDERTRMVVDGSDATRVLAVRDAGADGADGVDHGGWDFRPDRREPESIDEAFLVGRRDVIERCTDGGAEGVGVTST